MSFWANAQAGACPQISYIGRCDVSADDFPPYVVFYNPGFESAEENCSLEGGTYTALNNSGANGDWLFEDDREGSQLCSEVNGTQVTPAYREMLISQGAQVGRCPGNYFAYCPYQSENYSEANLWFYPEFPRSDAISTCGENGGTYHQGDETVGGPVSAPAGTPPNPAFSDPFNYPVKDINGVIAACTEIEAAGIADIYRANLLEVFAPGKCTGTNYVGVCHRPSSEFTGGWPMKDYMVLNAQGPVAAGAFKVACENTAGVWTSF